MRQRGVFLAAFLAAVLALGGQGFSQEAAKPLPRGAVILTLDQERVYRDSVAGQAIEAAIAAENDALATENRKIDAALGAEEQDLTTRRPELSPTEFQALAEAFNVRVEGLRSAQQSKAKALERKREEERQKFFQALVPVLGAIMRDAGAFVILNNSAVLVSFDQIDVTAEAIGRMNRQFPTALTDPAPEGPAPPAPDPAPAPAP